MVDFNVHGVTGVTAQKGDRWLTVHVRTDRTSMPIEFTLFSDDQQLLRALERGINEASEAKESSNENN